MEEDRMREFHGVFTVCQKDPIANGRPHYKATTGGHLYYSATGKWFLNKSFTPDKTVSRANIQTSGEVPTAGVWQWCTGRTYDPILDCFADKWTTRKLMLAELTPTQLADLVVTSMAQAERVRPHAWSPAIRIAIVTAGFTSR